MIPTFGPLLEGPMACCFCLQRPVFMALNLQLSRCFPNDRCAEPSSFFFQRSGGLMLPYDNRQAWQPRINLMAERTPPLLRFSERFNLNGANQEAPLHHCARSLLDDAKFF